MKKRSSYHDHSVSAEQIKGEYRLTLASCSAGDGYKHLSMVLTIGEGWGTRFSVIETAKPDWAHDSLAAAIREYNSR